MKSVSVTQAHQMFHDGAVLIDVRTPAEHRAFHIPGTKNIPLSEIDTKAIEHAASDGHTVLLHCKSGVRSQQALGKLSGSGKDIYSVDGGIEAWQSQGFDTVTAHNENILPLNQQVQLVISFMILGGLALSEWVTPYGLILPLFAGLGLLNAGLTGWCGMAKILARMPWNQ